MHELSIAMSLVEEVGRILDHEKAKRAVKISVTVGALSGIEKEALETCFSLAVEGGRLEGAALEILDLPVEVECQSCKARSIAELPDLSCRACTSRDTRIIQGYEMIIKSVEVEHA